MNIDWIIIINLFILYLNIYLLSSISAIYWANIIIIYMKALSQVIVWMDACLHTSIENIIQDAT